MSINKAQLELLASGLLNNLGESHSASLKEGGVMDNILIGVAQGIVDALKESIIKKDVKATGRLYQGIDTSATRKTASGIEVAIVMPSHWRAVEYGQRPGTRPKVKDIEEWISAKGIKVRQSRTHSLKTVMAQRHSLAVAIANKIERVGTIKRFGYKGSGFIREVLTPDNMRQISEMVAKLAGKKIHIYLKSPYI